jgi:hypothetical protein
MGLTPVLAAERAPFSIEGDGASAGGDAASGEAGDRHLADATGGIQREGAGLVFGHGDGGDQQGHGVGHLDGAGAAGGEVQRSGEHIAFAGQRDGTGVGQQLGELGIGFLCEDGFFGLDDLAGLQGGGLGTEADVAQGR